MELPGTTGELPGSYRGATGAEYYIVKKIGSKNRVLKPYAFTTVANSSTNHPFPYNTALADSSTALSMRSFFNDQTNNRQLIPKDNCCFSDYQSCITTNSLSRGYLSLINNVRSWTTGYIPGRTTPCQIQIEEGD